MSDILVRAGCFIAIILLGFTLRRIGFFKKEDFHVISRICVKITLTAAIVVNFSGRELQYSMLLLSLMGLGFGVLLMAVAYLLNRSKGKDGQAFAVLNSSGVNIGNFVLPFAQNFLGPVGVMSVSLFDMGNSFICLGGAFSVASMVKEGNRRFSFKPILRALTKSVPLITYVLMTILSVLRIRLPGPAVELAGIIGNANAFMAMLMIGVGFSLSGDREQLGAIVRIILPRYGIGLVLSVCSFVFLPLPLEYRQALVLTFLGPIASAAPAFTAEMKSDYGLSSAINSISILISIVLIVTALLIVL